MRGVRFAVYDALDIEIEPHVHEDTHLIFVFAGCYLTDAASVPVASSIPTLVFNPAGTAHRDRFLGPGGRFLAINVPQAKSREGKAVASRKPVDIARMKEVVEELEYGAPTLLLEEVALAVCDEVIVDPSSAVPAWVERVFEMLMDEPPGSITLSELAKEAGIHPGSLARTFRKKFGRTAGQLLRDRQFERASDLLLTTDHTVADIAVQLGFYDQPHFTRFCQRYSGLTPGQLRKRQDLGSKFTRRDHRNP